MTTEAQDPCVVASSVLFARYLVLIDGQDDPLADDPRLSLANLAWMCRIAIEGAASLPVDKISRWLGFVQGCLAMRGLIDVDVERDFSRPLFHGAYAALGIGLPPTMEAEPRENPDERDPG
ncbi:hypothetical protein LAZ40_03305 [Cereibacter sphaeroides]|uniref:hypothetical protein n=1 Tax=Cereibacter sphaeroides TaxID=1063 RepID=UPI001F248299|nr:hypothetical protein [Cereibacter sphaeroides]MCE6958083.1 hypothetical protein [Cereibacter sphaeroides]MCE6971430.1 hypothetical protein [Cereibacter sphaeroides]